MSKQARKPTHPGELLKEDILPTLGITQSEFANLLGLSRKTINEILAGKAPIRPETAIKLGTMFGNEPQFWIKMQGTFDVWEALQSMPKEDLKQLENLQLQMVAMSAVTAIQKKQFS